MIFLVYSCSKEEIEPIQLKSEQQDLIISANEVAGLKEALHASLRIDQHGGFSVYQASEHTASEFTIDYEHVRQKIDSSGNILFTFGLFDKDNDPKTFMNMILKKDIDHGYQTPYILKFEMTEEFFKEFQFSHSLLNFEGTIKKLAFAQNSQPATYQANIENTRSSTSTVSCPDGNTIEMSNQQRKHDQTTTNELGDNPGSSGTIITTYEICEYFLVTTTWLVNGGTEFAYTYEDTTIEVECTTETISEDFNQLSANTGSDPCDALNDDVGVFYPNQEELIYGYFHNNPCAQELFDRITQLTENGIRGILDEFSNEETSFDLFFNSGQISSENHAQTNPISSSFYEVTIDSDFLNNATDLAIARVIIHESIHAYISLYTTHYAMEEPLKSLKTFNQLWADMKEKKYGPPNTNTDLYHHEEMARNYTSTISKALKEVFGDQYDNQVYDDLAWSGLMETETFPILITDDNTKSNIAHLNNKENTGATDALGQKCNE